MRIINKELINKFIKKYANSKNPLNSWAIKTQAANWKNPSDIQQTFANVSILKNKRVVFNIGGNNYRLIAVAELTEGNVHIRWIGTHEQYNDIDAETI
ncbi:MAG: hypothetical protein FMNOHCHN_03026 [Ignavibacteriaceae bacterium]|nr:hypothetical protein [Ignavibacteriaceae bacterium]